MVCSAVYPYRLFAVMENTDKIPEIGDSFDYKDLHFEVVETDGRRAEKVKVTKTVTEIEEQNEE